MVSTISDPNQLTPEQQDIIVAAMDDRGRFEVSTRSDTRGKAVRTKEAKFFDPNDPQVARKYIAVVKDLERLLFVREDGDRGKYELTNFGWLIGRKLKQGSKQPRTEAGSHTNPETPPAQR